jgi:pimeloyl-ACP methyl ester carboxylesterase
MNADASRARAAIRFASWLDRAAARADTWTTLRSAARRQLSHEDRITLLRGLARALRDASLESPDVVFPPPSPIRPDCRRVRNLAEGGGAVFDASWLSGHVPLQHDLESMQLDHANNRTAHARLFLARRPRPVVILVHGYRGGRYCFEQQIFPVRWMMQRGFDVALIVLPCHAIRDPRGGPSFPGADPRVTVEGCRQSVHDIRGLAAFLRGRGAPSVGVMGMSLGGYLTALVATVEHDLAFAIPMIPVASFADFARDHGRLGDGDDARAAEEYRAYDDALQAVAPLARSSRLPPERVLVLAADHDRIAPTAHAERLAAHFRARLVTFPGGHLLQLGRGKAFQEVERFWGHHALGGNPGAR